MPWTGFEAAISAITRPRTYTLDGTATGIGVPLWCNRPSVVRVANFCHNILDTPVLKMPERRVQSANTSSKMMPRQISNWSRVAARVGDRLWVSEWRTLLLHMQKVACWSLIRILSVPPIAGTETEVRPPPLRSTSLSIHPLIWRHATCSELQTVQENKPLINYSYYDPLFNFSFGMPEVLKAMVLKVWHLIDW